ncbi:hypothetical protein [Bradyrhizobium elkanii]|nr:hypothetical protein [Bradyrhizobium elkanii]
MTLKSTFYNDVRVQAAGVRNVSRSLYWAAVGGVVWVVNNFVDIHIKH